MRQRHTNKASQLCLNGDGGASETSRQRCATSKRRRHSHATARCHAFFPPLLASSRDIFPPLLATSASIKDLPRSMVATTAADTPLSATSTSLVAYTPSMQ